VIAPIATQPIVIDISIVHIDIDIGSIGIVVDRIDGHVDRRDYFRGCADQSRAPPSVPQHCRAAAAGPCARLADI
jgi:hypothetical protein